MWELQQALGEIAGLPHVSLQPSAGSHGELAGVLLTRAYHEDRGEYRTKVLTPDTAHGTNPATVTMAGYEVVKVGTDERGGRRRRRPAREGRRRRRVPDAHEPEHARAVRREHHRDREDRARRRRDALLRRGEPQRRHGPHAPGRHGLRHRPLQPAQDLHAAARRRRPGRRPDRGLGPHRALPAAPAGRAREHGNGARPDLRPRLRPAEVDRPPARLPGQLRRLRALLRLHPVARRRRPPGGVGDRGAERQLPARAAQGAGHRRVPAGRLRPRLHARVRALGRADEEAARAQDARPRQAPARPRLPPADGLLPAAGRRGAAGRADRDGDEGDARRVRRRDRARSSARAPRIPEIARNAPYSTPVRRLDEAGAAKRPVIRQPL